MKTILLIILLFSTNVICGQKDSTKIKWQHKDDSKFCLKFAPLSLLPFYTGSSIRLGAEYKLKDTWSFYNELGYFIDNTGGIIKFELKHYLEDLHRNAGTYVSAELTYKYQHYQTTDSVNPENLPYTKYEKNYAVTKHVECLTIKFGTMKVFRCGILIDGFVGLGIRFKQATNGLTSEENKNIVHSSDYGPNVFTNQAGIKIYPNIDLGVKIGYSFK